MKNQNNFDGVRIGLATIVVFAHVVALTDLPQLKAILNIFDASFAVKGFFAISGFLVAKSYFSSASLFEYAEKRIRRIYPAYGAVVIFCFCMGMYTTTQSLSDFLTNSETFKYLAYNLVFFNFMQPTLPSVFTDHPVSALNGSLWTIKVELTLYFFLPFFLFLFRKIGAIKTTLVLFLFSVFWVYFFSYHYTGMQGAEIARQFPGQLSYFMLGSLFAVNYKLQFHLKWIALTSVILLFSINHPYAKLFIDPISYSSIVIYLSSQAFKNLNFGKYGDVSYGIYLYHFPIIQFLIFLNVFEINPWLGLSATAALTLIAAFISWHMIEKYFLKRTSHYVVATGLSA